MTGISDRKRTGGYRAAVADPRIIAVELDEGSIGWRSADIEQERRIAIFDLIEGNSFAPQRVHADDYAGPYRLKLESAEGRLGLHLYREDGSHLETLVLGARPLPPADQGLFRDLRQLLPGDPRQHASTDRGPSTWRDAASTTRRRSC